MEKTPKSNYLENTYICLLAGGSGTRLWPRSRKQTPKQFVPILSRKTLFQETIARAEKLVPSERIFVAANKDYVDDVRRQSPQIPRKNIIGEPEKKNTAMAMGTAAAYIHKRNPQAVIVWIEPHALVVVNGRRGHHQPDQGLCPVMSHTGFCAIIKCQRFPLQPSIAVWPAGSP